MIFDWIANSEKALKAHRLSDLDDWEKRRRWTQECCVARYARHTLGWDEARCRSFWESLPNGTAKVLAYDGSELEGVWRGLWDASAKLGPLKPLPAVPVTSGDIGYLDSLQAPLWVKRYWLGVLVWAKTQAALSGVAKYDPYVNAWLVKRAAGGKNAANAQKALAKWSLSCGRPLPLTAVPSGKGVLVAYRFGEWCGVGGDLVEARIDDLGPAEALLSEKPFTCPACGARHSDARLGGSFLCGRCKIKRRAEANRKAHRKYDEKKRRSQAASHQ